MCGRVVGYSRGLQVLGAYVFFRCAQDRAHCCQNETL
jgi:hypothetical protein